MKSRAKKNVKFLFFLVVLCLLAFGGAILIKKDDTVIDDLLDSFGDNSIKDNYNGFYSYSDDLNGSKTLFKGCILSKINNYILIINDNYYIYRSSCIGTFLLGEGKTKDLNIMVNEERKSYYIKYNDEVYYKNYAVTSLDVVNSFKEYNDKIPLTDYQLLLKEATITKDYFDVSSRKIEGLSSNMLIEFKHVNGESYTISIKNSSGNVLYTYTFKDFETMPEFYPYGAYLVIIEKDENDNKYNNNFKVIGTDGLLYNLNDKFPIIVDNVVLNRDKSIHISFDKKNLYFRVIISDSKKMCYEDNKSTDISYYEFMIDYNYSSKSFEKPEFVKKGFKSDSCIYINEILGG